MPDNPSQLNEAHAAQQNRLHDRRFQIGALLVCLIVAGLLSLFASSSPDGLNRVAEDTGFAGSEVDSATAGSPAAGYEASFMDGVLGTSLVRVIGVLVTLAIGYALFRMLARGRRHDRVPAPGTDRP